VSSLDQRGWVVGRGLGRGPLGRQQRRVEPAQAGREAVTLGSEAGLLPHVGPQLATLEHIQLEADVGQQLIHGVALVFQAQALLAGKVRRGPGRERPHHQLVARTAHVLEGAGQLRRFGGRGIHGDLTHD
jgi:hypothetical protein